MDTPDDAGSKSASGKRVRDVDLQFRFHAAYAKYYRNLASYAPTERFERLAKAAEKKRDAYKAEVLRSGRVR